MTINEHLITITYSFREAWQRRFREQLPAPVVVKMYPGTVKDRQQLSTIFSVLSMDFIFIIKEYLSTVKERFDGIRFDYELVNHAIKLKENREDIEYYRAELLWQYKE